MSRFGDGIDTGTATFRNVAEATAPELALALPTWQCNRPPTNVVGDDVASDA